MNFDALALAILWVENHVESMEEDPIGSALAYVLRQWGDEETEAGGPVRMTAATFDAALTLALDRGDEEEDEFFEAAAERDREGGVAVINEVRPFVVRLSGTVFFELQVEAHSLQEAKDFARMQIEDGNREALLDGKTINVKVIDITEGGRT